MKQSGNNKFNLGIIVSAIICIFFSFRFLPGNHSNDYYVPKVKKIGKSNLIFYYIPLKDTLYYLGDDYIEINLKLQLAFHITRDGEIDTVKISSGNKYLSKGIETPTGLFAVQNKAPIQISRQFENTEMLNWIGFSGNIGFHGLKKRGYYSSLGRRPSSHGCVRMSNEDGIRWYKKIKIGIPVLVYKSKSERVIKFASFQDFNPREDIIVQSLNSSVGNFLNERLMNIQQGYHYWRNSGRVFLASMLRSYSPRIVVETNEQLTSFQLPKLVGELLNENNNVSTFVYTDIFNISDTCQVKR
ncbi:MAG: L,D-transpeptidase [Ignavibacteria bacterium]|nr:L,D-transpeptidase [Ignavibacteria bacterium]